MPVKKIILLLTLAMSINYSFSQEKKICVYAFVAEDCPISIFMASSLKTVAEMYAGKINFYLVFPFSTSTNKSATAFKSKNKLTLFTNKIDKDQRITQQLGATVTPEVVVTGEDETILYRGRINDAYQEPGKRKHIYTNNDLVTALEKISTGKEMPKPWRRAIGCYITKKNE
jgi:peroxiredoxin